MSFSRAVQLEHGINYWKWFLMPMLPGRAGVGEVQKGAGHSLSKNLKSLEHWWINNIRSWFDVVMLLNVVRQHKETQRLLPPNKKKKKKCRVLIDTLNDGNRQRRDSKVQARIPDTSQRTFLSFRFVFFFKASRKKKKRTKLSLFMMGKIN